MGQQRELSRARALASRAAWDPLQGWVPLQPPDPGSEMECAGVHFLSRCLLGTENSNLAASLVAAAAV